MHKVFLVVLLALTTSFVRAAEFRCDGLEPRSFSEFLSQRQKFSNEVRVIVGCGHRFPYEYYTDYISGQPHWSQDWLMIDKDWSSDQKLEGIDDPIKEWNLHPDYYLDIHEDSTFAILRDSLGELDIIFFEELMNSRPDQIAGCLKTGGFWIGECSMDNARIPDYFQGFTKVIFVPPLESFVIPSELGLGLGNGKHTWLKNASKEDILKIFEHNESSEPIDAFGYAHILAIKS